MNACDNIPDGFAYQLSINEKAMRNFSKMTEDEKIRTLNAIKELSTRGQISDIVKDIENL